jgi:hypothetical protein
MIKSIDTTRFEEIKSNVTKLRDAVPQHSLDWNIYQGKLDLLSEVEYTIFEAVNTVDEKPAKHAVSQHVAATKDPLKPKHTHKGKPAEVTDVTGPTVDPVEEVKVQVEAGKTAIVKDGEESGKQG